MHLFILDSNIIWSTAFNAKSKIGRFILFSSSEKVKFYAPTYLKEEVEEQIPRVAALSKQSEQVSNFRNILNSSTKVEHYI